jgi:7-cyano-7-deazaguanine synthase
MANLATKAGVEGRPLRIHTPLIDWTKTQIIQRGLELGMDFGLTHSCYDPQPDGAGQVTRACGHCDACLLRQRAFEMLGMSDPVLSG